MLHERKLFFFFLIFYSQFHFVIIFFSRMHWASAFVYLFEITSGTITQTQNFKWAKNQVYFLFCSFDFSIISIAFFVLFTWSFSMLLLFLFYYCNAALCSCFLFLHLLLLLYLFFTCYIFCLSIHFLSQSRKLIIYFALIKPLCPF